MAMKGRGMVVVALLVLILGVMIGLETRAARQGSTTLGPSQVGDMAELLLNAEKKDAQLAHEVSRLRAQLLQREQGVAAYKSLMSQLSQARQEAGLTPVTGAGLEVVLTDPPNSQGESIVTVHDTDLLLVLNELRAAGATAISVNSQRVVATTEIRQAGGIFSINNTPAGPPFTVLATGTPQTLSAALNLRGGILDTLRALGIGVVVKSEKHVTVPAYQGPLP